MALQRSQIYWSCQVAGWSLYVIINSVFSGLYSSTDVREYLAYLLMPPAGILVSHAHRIMLLRFKIMHLNIPRQVLYIFGSSVVNGVILFFIMLGLSLTFSLSLEELTPVKITESVINLSVIFCIWNFIYFGFKYFESYKRSEIDAFRYLAASRESEINSLKAQLNPHFIFNCLNSIRALIPEDPSRAKLAVTQLSNILRNTLMLDKSREVPLREEIGLVRDFLELEHIRYEERLEYEIAVEEGLDDCLLPPFLIQSQVENAIKHGISRLPGTGRIIVRAAEHDGLLKMSVSNTGRLSNARPETGVGFANSVQRLQLLYGSKGSITIRESGPDVVVDICVPYKTKTEKINV